MALIKCKECGQQMSSSAKVCPHCGKQRTSSTTKGCLWLVVLVAVILVIVLNQSSNDSESVATTPATSPVTATASPPAEPAEPAAPVVPPDPWNYRAPSDSMTGKPVHTAWVESDNTVDFSFPYAGSQHATLALRKHPRYGTDVIFSIESGQFGCSFDGCSILVRFDDGPAERYTGNEPEDHSTTTVFVSPASRFISHLRQAKTVKIESSFFQQGRQVFTFDISGFDKNKFGG